VSVDPGIQVSVNGLNGVADQLETTAGVLHGHADTIEGVSIPASAFGAHEAAAGQFVADQQSATTAARGAATRVQGHGAHARSAAGGYVSTDSAASARVRSVQV
jgi:hypothetical protein